MRRRDTPRFVYFVEAGEGGAIKIGVTANVQARIKAIQTTNPLEIRLIAAIPGDHRDERRLHKRFKDERLNGEWFRGYGAVRAFAVSMTTATPEECLAEIRKEPPKPPRPVKAQRPPKPPRPEKRRKRERRHYTSEEIHSMLYVGDGGSIYRSAETEEALVQPTRDDWRQYVRRQNEREAEERLAAIRAA